MDGWETQGLSDQDLGASVLTGGWRRGKDAEGPALRVVKGLS